MNTEVVRYQVILFGISAGRYLGTRKHNFDTLRDALTVADALAGSTEWLGYVVIKDTPNSWSVECHKNGQYVDVVDGNLVVSNHFKNTMIDPEKS
jgi:hypothetical protein